MNCQQFFIKILLGQLCLATLPLAAKQTINSSIKQGIVTSQQAGQAKLGTTPPAHIKVTGKKAVIGAFVTEKERNALTKANEESTHDIPDSLLEQEPHEDEQDIETSSSFMGSLKERFEPLREKLSNIKDTIASKQNILESANEALGEKRSPLAFEFPVLGRGYFKIVNDPLTKGIRLNIEFKKKDKSATGAKGSQKTLTFSPMILNTMSLEMIEGKLKGQKLHKGDTVTVFGEEATFRLKSIDLGAGGIIGKVILEVVFKKPLKKTIPFINEQITITRAYLTLKAWDEYPIKLTFRTIIRDQKVRAMLLYAPQQKLTAALQVRNMALKSLIPPVSETPLANMQITQGTVYVDLWVPKPEISEDEIHIPENDPSREVRIVADLAKMEQFDISEAAEDVEPEAVTAEVATDLTDDIQTNITQDATEPVQEFPPDEESVESETTTSGASIEDKAKSLISDAPASDEPQDIVPEAPAETTESEETPDLSETTEPIDNLDNPDLAHPGDITVDPDLVEDETPDLSTVDTEDGNEGEEETQTKPTCDFVNDPCCREKDENGNIELDTSYTLEASISKYSANIMVGGNDVDIPHVGVVGSATISLNLQRSATEREDVSLRPNLKKKTLKNVESYLNIDMSCLPIKNIGMLETGNITIELQRGEREKNGGPVYKMTRGKLNLTGRMRLQFGSLGRLPIDVNAVVTRKGLIFTGTLDFCEQYEQQLDVSDTGRQATEKRCLKNSLSYGGMTLENVKVMYGYPAYTAEERDIRRTQKAVSREITAMKAERRTAIRQVKEAMRNGKKLDPSIVTAATQTVPSQKEVRKPDQRKQLSLVATVKLWGLRLIATLALVPDPKNLHKRKVEFVARAVFKDFQPFKRIKNVPGLRDITFGEVSAELRLNSVRGRTRPSIKLAGAATLFGMLFRANLKFVTSKKGKPGVFIYTTPQPQQSLADIIPPLQGVGFFNGIICCNSSFALSSVSEIDTAFFSAAEMADLAGYNLSTIRKGVLFSASVPLTGTLEPAGKWLGINRDLTKKELDQAAELEKEQKKARAQLEKERAEALARGENPLPLPPIPPKDFCSGMSSMFQIMGNINLEIPALSEFRVMIGKSRIRQFSQTAVHKPQPQPPLKEGEKPKEPESLYAGHATRFSDTTAQPFAHASDKWTDDQLTADLKLKIARDKELAAQQAQQAAELAAQQAALPPEKRDEKPAEPMVELDQIEIFFLGDVIGPRLGVAVGILVRPTPQELLRLKGSVDFSFKDVTIGAQMLGTWHNAFTLKGWDLSNVSLMLGFLYGTPFPDRLGGSAYLKIHNTFDAGFKFVADADVSNMGFEGNIDRVLTLFDIIDIFLKATKFPLPEGVKKLPMLLEIRNVYARYAPKDLRVGDQLIERGFALKADVTILKKQGHLDIRADDNGLKAFGTIEKINVLDLLKITSADGKGDPKIDIEVTLDRQNFLITGLINIANIIQQSSFVEIASDGFKFEFIQAVGPTLWHNKPLLLASVKGATSGTLTDPQFNLNLEFQQYFQDFIKEQVQENFKIAEKAISDELTNAQHTIDRVHGVVDEANRQIDDARKQVTNARGALQKIQEAHRQTNDAFNSAKSDVDKIRQEIKELDQWYNSLPTV